MQKVKKGRIIKYRVQYTAPDGLRKSAWFDHAVDAKDFEEKNDQTRQRMAHGLSAPVENILLIDAFKDWLETSGLKAEQGHGAYSYWVSNESKGRRVWVPQLGNYPLRAITKGNIIQVLDGVLTGKIGVAGKGKSLKPSSAATRNRHLAMMHKFFEDQIDLNRMEFNPAARIEMLSEKKRTRELIALTEGQAKKYLRQSYKEVTQFGRLMELLLGSGARVSEGIALTVGDIDLPNNTIRVRRTLEIVSGRIEDRTKGQRAGGEYQLPLFPSLRKHVMRWMVGKSANDFLVTDPNDASKHFSYWAAERIHARAVKASGVPRITIHDLRRTYATLASNGGFTTQEVQTMLGHSSVTVTERYMEKSASHIVKRGKALGFGKVLPLRKREAASA